MSYCNRLFLVGLLIPCQLALAGAESAQSSGGHPTLPSLVREKDQARSVSSDKPGAYGQWAQAVSRIEKEGAGSLPDSLAQKRAGLRSSPLGAQTPSDVGLQQRRRTLAAPTAASHIRLFVKLTPDGGAAVLSAVELPDPAPPAKPSEYGLRYELADQGGPLFTSNIPDPFVMRSMEDRSAGGRPHAFLRSATASIAVDLPKDLLSGAANGQLYLAFHLPSLPIDELHAAPAPARPQDSAGHQGHYLLTADQLHMALRPLLEPAAK